jgi:hypothetical protein
MDRKIINSAHESALLEDRKRRQGRSKKRLRPMVRYVGGIYIARYDGRAERFFGDSPQQALAGLKGAA